MRESNEREKPKPIWVRPKTAIEIGGFGMTTLYDLIATGKLKTAKVGGMRLISVASLEALAE